MGMQDFESGQQAPQPQDAMAKATIEPGVNIGRRSGLSKKLGVLLVSTSLAFTGLAFKKSADYTASATTGQALEQVLPTALGNQADSLIDTTVAAWANHQLPAGNFADPVSDLESAYGVSMIGQAMVETGVASNNQALVADGLRAIQSEVERPNDGVFETFSLASAYAWDQANLDNLPQWQSMQGAFANYLAGRTTFNMYGVASCASNESCYDNKKLVAAFADIELEADGVGLQSSADSTAHNPKLNKSIDNFLQQAVDNTSSDGKELGPSMQFNQAGILSDPTENPLAYDDLSAMILGHVIEALGPSNTPANVKNAFQRAARAIIGFMAPDGDVAYIGRGQGQVWNVAAAADALAIAANETTNPVWRGRDLAGVALELNRLQNVYTPGSWGMPLVPRLAGVNNPNYLGIDGYANSVEYNGLALWALQDAEQNLLNTSPAPLESIAADGSDVFIDPSQTRFATVRKGDLWWVIHAGDTNVDARYDFGLVAAEKDENGKWIPAMPYRPLTDSEASGGPVLVIGGKSLVPMGNKITAGADGTVKIKGGWANNAGNKPTVDTGTNWVFRPVDNGVALSFMSPRDRTYQFRVWYESGSTLRSTSRSLSVSEPDGRHEEYSLNLPITITLGSNAHSAYDENLQSSVITVHTTSADKEVSYITDF